MASIKLGSIVSDIRGVIGGTVFSRNGGGAYAKARTSGTNPNSTAQQTVRSIISACYAAWSALTAAIREDWGTYAKNVTVPNRLGDQINLSGYNMYCRTRAVLALIGEAMVAAAPTDMSLAEQDPTITITPSEAGGDIDVAYDNTLGWANEVGGHLLCYQGLPQNKTINSYDGPFKYAGKVDGAATPPTSPYAMTSLYTITEGQKCFMKFRVVRADGRVSSFFRADELVGA
jgi:hypothetical protein